MAYFRGLNSSRPSKSAIAHVGVYGRYDIKAVWTCIVCFEPPFAPYVGDWCGGRMLETPSGQIEGKFKFKFSGVPHAVLMLQLSVYLLPHARNDAGDTTVQYTIEVSKTANHNTQPSTQPSGPS